MSDFWSLYITVLTLGTLGAMAWLLYATFRAPPPAGEGKTTGESFDGIEEYDTPLPRWWLWLFGATLVFALVYLALYPGLGNWRGLMPGYEYLDPTKKAHFANGQAGWSSVHEWEREQAQAQAQYAPLLARFAATPVEALAKDPQAMKMGERLFASNCALCHGLDARGAPGFPDLTDQAWRWGGSPEAITTSILKGRMGVMPPWGPVLGAQGVADVTAYVLQLNQRPLPSGVTASAANGQTLFATTCALCHGKGAEGNPAMGAPNLAQAGAFIYGSSFAQVSETIANGRQGQMPAQQLLQGDDRVHVLAAYVWNLAHDDAER
ncbi:cytochrome-c oxidase, cbb3-type subunit III [Pseudomonas sp. RIT-PI-S]|uniref:cytochrome-c oxidase, cbb3-type subunit III n=1 Tax=Pseudomonas sp. RIT-PI-S TaxID=3035295 RepID=UPI0021DAFBB2|nr:cytochrome-c oxidase, cbb3-type subunit III [Pseudomonas sp. RIT-PI-S]